MSRPPTSTRLSALREAAGLTLLDAARHAGVTPDYLRRIERQGQAPYVLAQKLARRYGCSSMIFAHKISSERKISAGTTSPQKGDRATSKKRGTQSRQGARAKVPCLALATPPQASVATIQASAASAGTAAIEEGLQA